MATYQSPPIEPDPVPAYTSDDITIPEDSTFYRPDVTSAFFAAIESNDSALVTSLIEENPSLVHTPDPLRNGMLPLFFATTTGNTFMVALLAQRGAPIDDLSASGESYWDTYEQCTYHVMRTPLMAAVAQGSLPLVKLLFNDLKADDGVVAPDGVIALRLAKEREILALLPTRRKGGWRRFKHSQQKGLRRIKRAGHLLYRTGRFVVWDVPRFFVWDVPRYFLWDLPKKYLPSMGHGLLRAIKAIPYLHIIIYHQTKRFGEWIWRCLLGIPSFLKGCCKVTQELSNWVWEVTQESSKWVWKTVTKTIPALLLATGQFILRMLRATGSFTLQFLKDVMSFFHTVISAIISGFKNVTLKDVAHALSVVFISVPKFIWNTLISVAVAIADGSVWTVKHMGSLVRCLVECSWEIITWIPKQLGQILYGIGEITVAGFREVVLLINPKARPGNSSI